MRQFRIVPQGVAMPLITVKMRPNLVLPEIQDAYWTRNFVFYLFGPLLPELFALNCKEFGMDPGTPEDGVQVEFEFYGQDTINPADVWIKVQFSEKRPWPWKRIRIRDRVYNAIVGLFHEMKVQPPANLMLDIFWGPTNGRGTVNGVPIEW